MIAIVWFSKLIMLIKYVFLLNGLRTTLNKLNMLMLRHSSRKQRSLLFELSSTVLEN